MRRILILLLSLLLLAAPALAEDAPAIDLDAMTQEELLALHSALTTRIAVVNSGDVVYEEDGVTLVWNKLVDTQWANFYFGFTIYNRTGSDVWFELTGGGVNGIEMGPNSNTGRKHVMDGMAMFTGGYSHWLVTNMLKELNMNHASEIYLQVSLYTDDNWRTEPFRVINVRFPVDEEIVLK
jgi:hypothetical protein